MTLYHLSHICPNSTYLNVQQLKKELKTEKRKSRSKTYL